MSLATIADAITTALVDVVQTHAFIPDRVVPPVGFVSFPDINYDETMSEGHRSTWRVVIVVSRATDRASYNKALSYVEPTSVRAALLADTTLDGTVSSLRVSRGTVGPIDIAGQAYLAASIELETYI